MILSQTLARGERKMSQHMPWDHPLFSKQAHEEDEKGYELSVAPGATSVGNSSSISGKKAKPAEKKDDNTKTKVALASKNAREKRKKEFEVLMEENSRLREERERFLQHIEMLQEKVVEMREKEGDIDLQLENDLLKAQLSEHSMFVSGLMRMANGVPTTEAEKKQLYRQGADYAVAHINSLLSRSVRVAGEWRVAKMPEGLTSMAVWYQHVTDPGTGLRRLNLRADQILAGVSADIVSSLYWSLWTSEAAVRELFEASNVDAKEISISSRVILQDELSCTATGDDGEDKEESLATLYTRDDRAHHVFIASKREQSIARGSLALAMVGDDVEGQMIQPWKRRKCRMCARSNTNINRLQQEGAPARLTTSSSSSASALPDNSSLNNPTYVEGSVAWDLDDGRGCRIASIISLVEGFKVGKFDAFELITKDGWVSDKFAAFIKNFGAMLRAQYPPGHAHLASSSTSLGESIPANLIIDDASSSSSAGSSKKKRSESGMPAVNSAGSNSNTPLDNTSSGARAETASATAASLASESAKKKVKS